MDRSTRVSFYAARRAVFLPVALKDVRSCRFLRLIISPLNTRSSSYQNTVGDSATHPYFHPVFASTLSRFINRVVNSSIFAAAVILALSLDYRSARCKYSATSCGSVRVSIGF
jgi:hypothetical protein